MRPFTGNTVVLSIIGFEFAFMCTVLCSKPWGTLGEISDTLVPFGTSDTLVHFGTPAENRRSTHLLLLTPVL
jgi:hypothetical protein